MRRAEATVPQADPGGVEVGRRVDHGDDVAFRREVVAVARHRIGRAGVELACVKPIAPSPPMNMTRTATRSSGMKPSRTGSAFPGSMRMYLKRRGAVPEFGTLARVRVSSIARTTSGPGAGT